MIRKHMTYENIYRDDTFTEELLILTFLSLVREDKVMIPDYK